MEKLYEIIGILAEYHAGLILLALGIVLILVDYFARTDVPAHFGYFCFGAAMFFAFDGSLLTCALIALGAWVGFEILHAIFLRRYLANAEPAEEPPSGGETSA